MEGCSSAATPAPALPTLANLECHRISATRCTPACASTPAPASGLPPALNTAAVCPPTSAKTPISPRSSRSTAPPPSPASTSQNNASNPISPWISAWARNSIARKPALFNSRFKPPTSPTASTSSTSPASSPAPPSASRAVSPPASASRSSSLKAVDLESVLAAANLAQQAQNFHVQPDQRDHQPEGALPLHVLRCAHPGSGLDHVKINDQVQRRDNYHEQTDPDSQWRGGVKKRHLRVEEQAHHHADEVNDRASARGRNPGELETVRRLHDAHVVRQQHYKRHTKCQADRLHGNPWIRLIKNRGDSAKDQPFEQCVNRGANR